METTKTIVINGHKLAVASLNTGNKVIVIFCHGYRSSSIGPNRFFVETSRLLAKHGISSIRFDQYGSGNSEGTFRDSSFNDWVASTNKFINKYHNQGFTICLFGQSMGGSTVIAAASDNNKVAAVVSWVPDPNIEAFVWPKSGLLEEGGQIVQAQFWKEAHEANIASKLRAIGAPTYIVQCSEDEYVSAENHQAIIDNARQKHIVETFEGYTHSSWNFDQATHIIHKSVDFIVETLAKNTSSTS